MTLSVPGFVAQTLEALEAAGYESYVVGGCVRDALLGREPHDWDIATAALPTEVERVFASRRLIETGMRHGTVTLLSSGGPLEITTFRSEGAYSDGRRPDAVTFVRDIHEDLRRRDFTINAMAYSPSRGLRDDFGGQTDLETRTLRCVGKPDERLGEDALRILRALRFAARYALSIAPETDAALRRQRERLVNVSAERIFTEIKGILISPGAGKMLLSFPEIFFSVFPEMEPMLGFDQHRADVHVYDVWEHTAHALDAAPTDTVLRLTMFFHDIGKPSTFSLDPTTGLGHFYGHPRRSAEMADEILRRLRCDNATREAVKTLVENHPAPTQDNPRSIRRLLSRLGEEQTRRLLDVWRADVLAHAPETAAERLPLLAKYAQELEDLLHADSCLSLRDLAVNGQDILALGVNVGPAVGKILRSLLEEILDEKLPNERESLLRRANEIKGGLKNE